MSLSFTCMLCTCPGWPHQRAACPARPCHRGVPRSAPLLLGGLETAVRDELTTQVCGGPEGGQPLPLPLPPPSPATWMGRGTWLPCACLWFRASPPCGFFSTHTPPHPTPDIHRTLALHHAL